MLRRSKSTVNDKGRNRTVGFIIMEVLLTIVIVGVFMAVIFRINRRTFDKVYILCDRFLLSSLAVECNSLMNGGNADLRGVTDMKGFATALAKAGGPNNVRAYQSTKKKNKKDMEIVIGGQQNAALKNEDFDFIAVLPNNNPTGRNVLFCTRGLQVQGKWSGEDSLYGHEGGLVVFKDGHTKFLPEHTGAAAHLAVWYD